MSEQARQVFKIVEQRSKDTLRVIKTIAPVISIIREWGKVERELSEIDEKIKELKIQKEGLTKALDIISDEYAKLAIEKQLSKVTSELMQSCLTKNELRERCKIHEDEVISYQEYAKLYNWINTIDIEKAIINGEEFLAIMFLVYNRGINSDCEFDYIRKKFPQKVQSYAYLRRWNRMLESIKENKI